MDRVQSKKCKIRLRGLEGGHVTHFWSYVTPLYFRNGLAKNFEFGTQIEHSEWGYIRKCTIANIYTVILQLKTLSF